MTKAALDIPKRPERRFFPQEFTVDNWETLEPYLVELQDRELPDSAALKNWLLDLSEMSAVLEESQAWLYIRMTINTADEKATEAYKYFIAEISPKVSPYSNRINKKLVAHPNTKELNGSGYAIYLRGVQSSLALYRDDNVPLQAAEREKAREYSAATGAMSINWGGKVLTIQQANAVLRDTDRSVREKMFTAIKNRRLQDANKLDQLFSELVEQRHTIALNADKENYRDYKFDALGRFDYTPQDCFDFHAGVAKEIVPILRSFQEERKERLDYATLRPWDLEVDPDGREPLAPFKDGAELIDASIEVFTRLHPYFGKCLAIMKEMGYLDLDSKQGKAPGGYNYPLYEIGVPFIFMNAVGTQRDLITMMHEGGHAVHSFLTRDLELTDFKSFPSEVAELASMSLELITMDHWDVFYSDPEELRRAKLQQMQRVLSGLPWMATVDKFQHWIYENPTHSIEERHVAWKNLLEEFSTDMIDNSGHEDRLATIWHAQLHIFELPFYYIEYGFAQLGAIALWRNYKKDPQKALEQYMNALSLGYTKTIPELYKAAGIQFNFSVEYVKELADFVKEEIEKIKG